MRTILTLLLLIFNFFVMTRATYPTWFKNYIKEHKKKYNEQQMKEAFHILQPKYHHIQKTSGDLHLRLHKNSDTNRKSSRRLHEMKSRAKQTIPLKKKTLGLPLEFDWRRHGTVTAVEEQGECGGCYCFSAIHHLEHWWKKATGNLTKLSVQECLDCTNKKIKYSDGCGGGLMEDLFKLAKHWTVGKANENPFAMRNKVCPRHQPKHGIRVKSYHVLSDEFHSQIERNLAHNLLHYGPIPVGVDSRSYNFELYRHGIIKAHHCGKKIDHAVTVVGYGIEKNTRYWIVKNSWGTGWGEKGYFRLERDHNACGINTYSSFVNSVELV